MGILISTYNYYKTRTDDPDPVTTLTSRDRYLVQSSWEPIKRDLTGYGVKLLIFLFQKFPEELQHFPFKDIPVDQLQDSKKFAAHCSNVMYSIDSIISQVGDPELLVNILRKVGGNHHRNKVEPISFWHTKEVILEFFQPLMSKEYIDAWDKTLRVAFGVIAEELAKK